ncbi:MAG: hypothetical protein ACAI35_22180 [Candidatus Methylacidiphilales bacterium]|nr:hypothetical protein [Candidatus Methylacidiphilales bacterium]
MADINENSVETNDFVKPGEPGSTEHVVIGYFDDASSTDAAIKDLIERGYPRSHIGVAYRDARGLDITPPSDWQWHGLTLEVPNGPAGERDAVRTTSVPTAVVHPSNYVDPTLPPAPYPGDALHPRPVDTLAPSPEVARVESQPVDTDGDGDTSDEDNTPHFVVAVAAANTTEAANILKAHSGDTGDANRIRSDVALMTGGTMAGVVAGAVLGGPAGAFVGGTVAGALAAATASND